MSQAHTLCHTITKLDVPRWADPRIEAQLRCHYTKQPMDPALHSVKWYRGSHEIFRYTPQEIT
ncbi:putative beat protein [Danaus plexippus plexippus]|uniref:Beat protein n=1 Tax=Danaus plexippus plexippus TaxID=278856 RepID=A0A212EIS7_DANPL|nr:putative beat protein [Danaus plexippus plexippus]